MENALGSAQVARILGVHPRTIQRRKAANKRPALLQAQRQDKLGRIWRELLEIFDPAEAVKWLRDPVPALDYRPPLEVMADDGGLDRVLEVIGRMSWGLPA